MSETRRVGVGATAPKHPPYVSPYQHHYARHLQIRYRQELEEHKRRYHEAQRDRPQPRRPPPPLSGPYQHPGRRHEAEPLHRAYPTILPNRRDVEHAPSSPPKRKQPLPSQSQSQQEQLQHAQQQQLRTQQQQLHAHQQQLRTQQQQLHAHQQKQHHAQQQRTQQQLHVSQQQQHAPQPQQHAQQQQQHAQQQHQQRQQYQQQQHQVHVSQQQQHAQLQQLHQQQPQVEPQDQPEKPCNKRLKRSGFPTSVAPGTVPPERRPTCDVCGDDSDRHHLNYGANVCFSCRAFFRRAHQQAASHDADAGPKFFCKWTGRCEVTVKNRRRCQKCRYDRCLAAGMRPECVLDVGQRQHRFRKAIKKREEATAAATTSTFASPPPSTSTEIATIRSEREELQQVVAPSPAFSSTTPEEQVPTAASPSPSNTSSVQEDLSALPPMKRIKRRYCRMQEEGEEEATAARRSSESSDGDGGAVSPPSPKVRLVDKSTSTDGLFWLPPMGPPGVSGQGGGMVQWALMPVPTVMLETMQRMQQQQSDRDRQSS